MFIVYKTEQEAGTCNEKVERVYLSSLHSMFSPPLRLLGVGGEIEMRAPSGVEPLTRGYAVSYLPLPIPPMPSKYLIKSDVMRP